MKESEKEFMEKVRAEVSSKSNSKERNAALTFKYFIDRKKFKHLLESVRFITLQKTKEEYQSRPRFLLRKRDISKYYHPGRWLKSAVDNKEMWTCCSSEFKDSQVIK